MSFKDKYLRSLYVSNRFFAIAAVIIMMYVLSYFVPSLFTIVKIITVAFFSLAIIDYLLLYLTASRFPLVRSLPERFSNGDQNPVSLVLSNPYRFDISINVIDELPALLQVRDFSISTKMQGLQKKQLNYNVLPLERGEYDFGNTIVLVKSGLGLLARNFKGGSQQVVPVYPSFLQLRNQQLLSHNTVIHGTGNRRVRKIGQSMEFEQIKDYVAGDDVRTINWKATARKGSLMTNHYVDEKSQQVFCLLDKGRLMKMPFEGLTLLDYSINSILSLQNICLQKQDKVGLITFSAELDTVIPADRKAGQSQKIMQALYKQETKFKESDFEMLYMQLRHRLKQRSLLLLYTNFETLTALKRQLPYLRSIARFHFLVVIFFRNTELEKISAANPENMRDIYIQTIAGKYMYEKRLIIKELRNNGILSIFTTPQELSANTINKYLEIKARQIM